MTERPMTAGAAVPRRRWLWGRLQDMSIWSKLGVIMIVPTLATVVVGVNGLIGHLDTASGANRARVLANLTDVSGELVHHLQAERAAAIMLLGAGGEAEDARAGAYVETQQQVDDAERPYQQHRSALTDVPANFRSQLDGITVRLAGLPQLRTRVTGGELGLTETSLGYSELINNLINIRDSSAQLAGEAVLGDRMRAAAAISRSKEALSRQRVTGHEVLIRGRYGQQLRTGFIGALAGHDQALETFNSVATENERTLLDQILTGPDVRQSLLYRDYLDSLEGERLGAPPWNADEWDTVMAAHANLLRDMEQQIDQAVVGNAVLLRDAVTQRVLIETGVLIAMLTLAILLAMLVARAMARSLRELRHGALAVAQDGLPQAVARLRDPAISTALSSEKVARQIAEPLPVRSRDEFGQVTEAFNAVHLEAVRTAAEQAQLRSSVATMFVNLARRSQILVDRLIGHLDRLERGEEDPDRLAELFQLDHLATRMRRNDENLLVLAGADSTRVQREPAGLIDVLRAAQSEVEYYTRIEFGVVDRDIQIAAHAVNDLVHLIAELFDNATVFSPPETQVVVEARRVGDRVALYVQDRGIGMSQDQFVEANERLAAPPMVDVAVSRMMGLVVISRLAARHGVKVELRPAVEQRGTIADVVLPATVLLPRAQPSHMGVSAAPTFAPPQPRPEAQPGLIPHQRPLSPAPLAPLALEGGRSAPLPDRPLGTASPPRSAQPASPPGRGDQPTPRFAGRPLPVWSDLTGASTANGAAPLSAPSGPGPSGPPPSGPVGSPAPPLPQRRPSESRPGDRTAIPDSPTEPQPQVPQPSMGSSTAMPTPPAPPAWPPVVPTSPAALPTNGVDVPRGGPSAGPAQPAATGLDQTAELPRLRTEAPVPYTPPQPAPIPVVDQTMELPIFNELESMWFRTMRRVQEQPQEPAAPPAPAAEVGPSTSDAETTEYATVNPYSTTTGSAAMGEDASDAGPPPVAAATVADRTDDPAPSEPDWRTAADDGWRAASSVAETKAAEVTSAGLPKRRPMAQLVPGGVEQRSAASTAVQRRTPEAVRGLLSAYHRGVQRGRKQQGDIGGASPSPSTQAGKEQEA